MTLYQMSFVYREDALRFPRIEHFHAVGVQELHELVQVRPLLREFVRGLSQRLGINDPDCRIVGIGKERAGVFGNRHAVFGGFSLEGFLLVFSHPHLDACFFSPHVAFGTSRFSRIIRLQIAPPRLQTVRNRAAGLPPTENRQL